MVRILVDSSADYSKEELAAKNLEMVPLTITVNGTDNYKDELELSRAELYRLLTTEGNIVKTSQPSPQDFLEKFEQIKAAGDEAVCIMLSSALSGTYQSAVLAKGMADYDGIHVIDSLTAIAAIRILADHALQLVADGHTAAEIEQTIEQLKGRVKIIAVVDTLKYLYLGGRVSRTTAIVADAVNVKPGIYVTQDGKVATGKKYFGVRRAVKELAAQMKNVKIDPAFPLYVVYSQNDANAKLLENALNAEGISVNGMHEIGATIGVHTGPCVFGIIYVEA